MKKMILTISASAALFVGCASDPKPTPHEQQKVEEQVAKDQAAQDSVEKVIREQIEKDQAAQ